MEVSEGEEKKRKSEGIREGEEGKEKGREKIKEERRRR